MEEECKQKLAIMRHQLESMATHVAKGADTYSSIEVYYIDDRMDLLDYVGPHIGVRTLPISLALTRSRPRLPSPPTRSATRSCSRRSRSPPRPPGEVGSSRPAAPPPAKRRRLPPWRHLLRTPRRRCKVGRAGALSGRGDLWQVWLAALSPLPALRMETDALVSQKRSHLVRRYCTVTCHCR